MQNVITIARREVFAINKTLADFGIGAGCNPNGSDTAIIEGSHISHRIRRLQGVSIADIEKRMRELHQAVQRAREQKIPVRLNQGMGLYLETPHPEIVPTVAEVEQVSRIMPHAMLLGRATYHNRVEEQRVSFDEAPHVLVAGITNAGKSVLMQMMMISLAYSTSPKDLQIVLVDLKNEDMVPFAKLPHVATFCKRPEEAVKAIKAVQDEKDKRIDNPDRKPYRIVVWIDELAQLANEKAAKDMLGDLASIGRSKSINLIAATQHPTKEGGIGSLMKANFPLRLVGMVSPGSAHIATGRGKTGAEMLPGHGAFLYCFANDVHRFQSFYLTHSDIERWVQIICRKWEGEVKPVSGLVSLHTSKNGQNGAKNDTYSQTAIQTAQQTGLQTRRALPKPSAGLQIEYGKPEDPQIRQTINRIYRAVGGNKNQTLEMLGWYPGHNKVTALEYLNYALGE